MDRDQVWQAIDDERASLAALLDDLSEQEWETPSLCAGWRVRDVAAHLTLSQTGLFPAVAAADRVWPDLFPWRAERKLRGFRLAATDCWPEPGLANSRSGRPPLAGPEDIGRTAGSPLTGLVRISAWCSAARCCPGGSKQL